MQSKREIIILAASEVFSEKGFHNAKIVDIAKAAGVGKGTIYEYFSSKSELFYEMAVFATSAYIQELKQVVELQQTFKEKMLAFVACQQRIIKDKMQLSACINNGSIVLDAELKTKVFRLMMDMQLKVAGLMETILKTGQNEGAINETIELAFVSDLIVNISFRFNMRCQSMEEEDPQKLIEFIMNGIGVK